MKHKMHVHLIGRKSVLWKIVCVGVNILDEDEPITKDQ